MRTRIFTLLVAFLAIAGNAVWGQETTKPSDMNGDGTTTAPYELDSKEDLEWFRDYVNEGNPGACAKLTDNIDLDSSEEWEPIGYADDTSFKYSYTGTFDGNGYTISGLCIGSDPQSIGSGLFRVVGIFDMFSFDKQRNGIVKNLIVEDGVCKCADRSALAGSIATGIQLIRVMVEQAGVPLIDVMRMAAETPARIMGILERKGTLEVGKDADIILFTPNFEMLKTWVEGRECVR